MLTTRHPALVRYLLLLACGHVVERPIARIRLTDRVLTMPSPMKTRCEWCGSTPLGPVYESYKRIVEEQFERAITGNRER